MEFPIPARNAAGPEAKALTFVGSSKETRENGKFSRVERPGNRSSQEKEQTHVGLTYTMQILHPFAGSVQQYEQQLDDIDLHRPRHCPQCQDQRPLTAHGFYTRTLTCLNFDGALRVRRYLCLACRRTVSLLPEFALPYLRSSITVIALVLTARLLENKLWQAITATLLFAMTYQRGQFWVRRFHRQAESLCAALAALTKPAPAPGLVDRALCMLAATGWIPAHRFLFAHLRHHLLGWPRSLAPRGLRAAVSAPPMPG